MYKLRGSEFARAANWSKTFRQARMEGVCGRSGNDAEACFVTVRELHNSWAAGRRHNTYIPAKSKGNKKANFTIKQGDGKEPSFDLGFARVGRELLLSRGRLQPVLLTLG